ncbi:hypothetical protein [Metabacillus endolithicus]|uniref:hypothetical protein n=1 Tax=Metabacillus endolithicus TaxID=1535204 RepID=UPI001FF88171|nr:hypothetical protein [Metabacillus endolithicus]UPG65518.1 hypothetical protein MVE64_11415 [Metabacillus endolithicus]
MCYGAIKGKQNDRTVKGENILISNRYEENEKGREILHHQMNPRDEAKKFTIDVKGLNQIEIYFNTHNPSSSIDTE